MKKILLLLAMGGWLHGCGADSSSTQEVSNQKVMEVNAVCSDDSLV